MDHILENLLKIYTDNFLAGLNIRQQQAVSLQLTKLDIKYLYKLASMSNSLGDLAKKSIEITYFSEGWNEAMRILKNK